MKIKITSDLIIIGDLIILMSIYDWIILIGAIITPVAMLLSCLL